MIAGDADHTTNRSDDPMTDLLDAAFRAASVKVVQQAEKHGVPVIVWEDDQIRYLTAAEPWERLRADAGRDVRPCRPPEKANPSTD